MTKDEALKMAIEALDTLMMEKGSVYQKAIKACEKTLKQPRNFCERCGKRASKDPYHIHTCTPPQKLEQPAQEPVAWMKSALDNARDVCKYLDHDMIKEAKAHTEFFWNDLDKIRDFDDTHPTPSWQGLSDDEIDQTCLDLFDTSAMQGDIDFARAIEKELRNKNE